MTLALELPIRQVRGKLRENKPLVLTVSFPTACLDLHVNSFLGKTLTNTIIFVTLLVRCEHAKKKDIYIMFIYFFLEVLRAPCIIHIRDAFHNSNLKMPKRRVPHSLADARAMLPLLALYQDGVALGTSVPWKLFCCAVLFS